MAGEEELVDEPMTILDLLGDGESEFMPEEPVVIEAPEEAAREIIVSPTDTWGRLALRYGVTADAIAAANKMTCRSLLHTGQRLRLPA